MLLEYRIVTESTLSKVYLLWKKFFREDKHWHFTLEGSYIEIRLSKRNKEMENYLKRKCWDFTKFKYIDNIPTTRKYQKHYETIFHGYATLIMKVIDTIKDEDKVKKEKNDTIERSIHLLFNLFGINNFDEAKWLTDYAVGRAHQAGYYQHLIESQTKK